MFLSVGPKWQRYGKKYFFYKLNRGKLNFIGDYSPGKHTCHNVTNGVFREYFLLMKNDIQDRCLNNFQKSCYIREIKIFLHYGQILYQESMIWQMRHNVTKYWKIAKNIENHNIKAKMRFNTNTYWFYEVT